VRGRSQAGNGSSAASVDFYPVNHEVTTLERPAADVSRLPLYGERVERDGFRGVALQCQRGMVDVLAGLPVASVVSRSTLSPRRSPHN
jgi:hypothetical protein